MKEIFFFDSMITPKIINVIYWLALFGSIVAGLIALFTGSFIAGLGLIIGGCVASRIYCELMIVLFKINESLRTIATK